MRWLLPAAAAVLVALAVPVLVQGAPLADDYDACVTVREQGLGRAFEFQWDQRGAVRPVHYLEILMISQCDRVPFGVLMLPGLAATITVGFTLRGLLRDLGAGEPVATVAGLVWLLQPLGTELALWPSAIHVPLGLLLALLSLRALHRGRDVAGLVFGLAACLSLEQVVFAMPVLAWVVVPADRRRGVAVLTAAYVLVVLGVYSVFPGSSPRNNVALADRLLNIGRDPDFYLRFPAIGLGLHFGVQALRWQPLAGIAALAAAGAWSAPALLRRRAPMLPLPVPRTALALAIAAVALNLPSLSYAPRDDSPRIFSPTWLLVAATVGLLVAAVRWRRPRLVGVGAGGVAGVCVLSLALSVSVRLRHADISREALVELAAAVPEGGSATICRVSPKVVSPTPAGAFSLHDLFYDWSAEPALTYHAGRHADVTVVYGACPGADADVVFDFAQLVPADAGRAG